MGSPVSSSRFAGAEFPPQLISSRDSLFQMPGQTDGATMDSSDSDDSSDEDRIGANDDDDGDDLDEDEDDQQDNELDEEPLNSNDDVSDEEVCTAWNSQRTLPQLTSRI